MQHQRVLKPGTVQAELKVDKEEVQRLKAALLEQEAAVLQRERQLADLKKQLKEARRQGEAPLQMDQATQAEPVQSADVQVQVCFHKPVYTAILQADPCLQYEATLSLSCMHCSSRSVQHASSSILPPRRGFLNH